jgi:hypothetical protein
VRNEELPNSQSHTVVFGKVLRKKHAAIAPRLCVSALDIRGGSHKFLRNSNAFRKVQHRASAPIADRAL